MFMIVILDIIPLSKKTLFWKELLNISIFLIQRLMYVDLKECSVGVLFIIYILPITLINTRIILVLTVC